MANYHDIKYNVDYAGNAGVLMPLASTTASSDATVSFTSGIDSTYDEYLLIWNDLHPEDNGDGKIAVQATTDGSNFNVTLTTTVFYAYNNEGDDSRGLTYHTGSDSAQGTALAPLTAGGTGNDNDQSTSGWLKLYNPSSTTFVKHFISRCCNYQDSDYTNDGHAAGYFNTTSAITGIRLAFTSGDVDAGTVQLFGVH